VHTKLLMIGSSVLMLFFGVLMSFLPQELLGFGGGGANPLSILIVQAAGALYLGFAMLNWMARANLIGGIYSRPVSLGNLTHFWIVAAALLKAVARGQRSGLMLTTALVYAVFAVWFGVVVFRHPLGRGTGQSSAIR
jgi:hypothetical protein